MLKKIKNKKGFTLIELIVVIAILAVLAAIIIPTIASNIQRANDSRDLANSRSALATYTLEILSGTVTTPRTIPVPNGSCVGNADITNRTVTSFVCEFSRTRFFYRRATGEIVGPVTARPTTPLPTPPLTTP